MNFKKIDIAGIIVEVEKSHPVGELILNELGANYVDDETEAIISISFQTNILSSYGPTVYSAKGSMNFNEDTFFVDYLPEISYSITNLFNSSKTIIKIDDTKAGVKKKMKSILTGKNILVKNVVLSYSLFWYAFHLELLRQNKGFIHSGIVKFNNSGIILTGTGGCGKTSSLFNLLENTNASYLSEDFGIISKNGNAFYNPKAVSIYASDMAFGKSILSDYKNKFDLKNKILWFIKKKLLRRNPMVKVNPDFLLNNRIENETAINKVLYLIRCDEKKFKIEETTSDLLLDRILDASMRELKTLNELLLLMRANAPLNYQIPSFEELRLETGRVYSLAFSKSKNFVLKVPHKSTPKELITFLYEKKIIK